MFVILEGPDGAGKSTLAKKAVELAGDNKWVYSQVFTHDSEWDEFIHKNPKSVFYYVDIVMKTEQNIKPMLAKGFTVIQDRYVQSVDSFLPDCKLLHNEVVRKVLEKFFLEPDMYVHVTASIEELLHRLSGKVSDHDEYHLGLINYPEKILEREGKYLEIYETLACPKYVLDTTERTPEDCTLELIDFIRRSKC